MAYLRWAGHTPGPACVKRKEPMNDTQRHLLTAGAICAASAALVSGIVVRRHFEDGSLGYGANPLLAPGLMASRSKSVEIPEERYFYDLTGLLKREFVEPIEDDTVLAIGAVKGMLGNLDDENSLFMGKELFQAYVGQLEGRYPGVGASFDLARTAKDKQAKILSSLDFMAKVPKVIVGYVAPGSPAEKAGLASGDEIQRVAGKWVVNPDFVHRLRDIQGKVKRKELPETALRDLQEELRGKLKNSMMPMRALEKLSTGEEGQIELEWLHEGKVRRATIQKSVTTMPVNVREADGAFRLALIPGAAEKLAEALRADGVLTIDLRGHRQGDLNALGECLEVVGPAGVYGAIAKESGTSTPLEIPEGVKNSEKVKILVDRQTAGAGEAFALALKAKGLATLEGGPMAGEPILIERTSLPDGSGFTLRIGKFVTQGGAK